MILPQTPNQSGRKDNIGFTSPTDSFRGIWFSEMNRRLPSVTQDIDYMTPTTNSHLQLKIRRILASTSGHPCPHFRPRKLKRTNLWMQSMQNECHRFFWVFWLGCSFHLTKTLYFEAVRSFNMYFISFLASEHEKRLANRKWPSPIIIHHVIKRPKATTATWSWETAGQEFMGS